MNKMKFWLSACLMLATISSKADIAATVMLHHNGKTTLFQWNEVQNAVDAAVDGDTIYLAEGTFSAFNVNKRIMVRGTGPKTIVQGACQITISGETPLGMPVLDAISFSEDIIVNSAYKQFTLRKIQARNLRFANTYEFYDMKLDRCYFFGYLWLRKNIREFNAFNCKVEQLIPEDYKSGKVTFEHCNINLITDTIVGATFNSCALVKCNEYSNRKPRTNFISCIFDNCVFYYWNSYYLGWSNCTFINCTKDSYVDIDFNGTSGSKTYISAIDNTYIGANGGTYPFTIYPALPTVTKHRYSVDAANKKLNVTLTVDKR